ncbi:DUF692 domain-containing protein [Alloalcanivorax sp.]|jgi:hypothetical protein|uniref:DUF692 domain-containing protein n=1 Tax=Alloalcanivorax TaxID=3020832 RepID=UPI00079CA9A8|nr:MAG: hypothetical protein AXW13_09530 [Alcanivorax sp. Nap_24]MEA3260918.1 DUF692 domain-containing protein [Pseudomonadota bacterium]MED5601702.1 DUF692 domain-containing protein [Pseudomonadota bacterium]NQY84867.1 DUF692 domain-containing protein [Alcanivorax sp.]|tara:strand:- start:8921 stop:9745 length:825 start_codon:yes stop_codon:yes gene_type:complete
MPPLQGVGLGLRFPHLDDLLASDNPPPWIEVLADNYLSNDGVGHAKTDELCAGVPTALHCVGMSVAGSEPLDDGYLDRVSELAHRFNAQSVSDHLAFCRHGAAHLHDLLPVPYTPATLDYIARRVDYIQNRLERPLLLENISCYVRSENSSWRDLPFLSKLAALTGCGVLLDINNLYVNSVNFQDSLETLTAEIPWSRVAQIHVAGCADQGGWLLDTHEGTPKPPVMDLLALCARERPSAPVLLEWDQNLPPLSELQGLRQRLQHHWLGARDAA